MQVQHQSEVAEIKRDTESHHLRTSLINECRKTMLLMR
jgi:hypothetical protein